MLYFQRETTNKLIAAIEKSIDLQEFSNWVFNSQLLSNELGAVNYSKLTEFDYWSIYSADELSILVKSIYQNHTVDIDKEAIILVLLQAMDEEISPLDAILTLGSWNRKTEGYYSVPKELLSHYYLVEDYEEKFSGSRNELIESLEEMFSSRLVAMQKCIKEYYEFLVG